MTKCILIDPPSMVLELSEEEARETAPITPPIGLAYIAAILRENEIDVKIIDAKSLRMSHEETVGLVEKEDPDFVGVTVFTPQLRSALRLCKEIKQACPDIKTVLGGPHIHAEHENIVKNDFIDFCVRVEGEYTTLELINTVVNGGDLGNVKGLTFKKGNYVIVNPDRPFIQNLDDLPFPARDLLPNHIYKGLVLLSRDKPFTLLSSSRGCPFRCKFCTIPKFWYEQRRRSVENVLDEIEHIYEVNKIDCIRFTDELFATKKTWITAFCRGLIDRGLSEKIAWGCDGRVDTVSEDMLKQMKEANCKYIFYGIEFGNQRILDFSGKGITIAQIRKAVELAKKVGITIEGNFMIGYPTETRETIEETIALAKSLDLSFTTFSIVTPFPGTELYDYCKENGLLKTDNWNEYNYFSPGKSVIKLKNVTDEELGELFCKANMQYYFTYVRDTVQKGLFDLLDFQEEVVEELRGGIKQLSANP